MLKQWPCLKRLWIASIPGVLTVTDDMLSYFPMSGGFASPVEMRLQDIVQVTPAAGLMFGRVSIQSLAQSMTLNILGESAEVVAKVIQAAVDRVKLRSAEPIRLSPSAAQDGTSP